MNYRYPRYINYCISLVQQQIEIDMKTMQVVADRCDQCSDCKGTGFSNPEFYNNTCPGYEGDESVAGHIFELVSGIISDIERTWQSYRDDALVKINYLQAKSFSIVNSIEHLYEALDPTVYYYIAYSRDPLFYFHGNLTSLQGEIDAGPLVDLNSTMIRFNSFFNNQTDHLIIQSNQKLNTTLVNNWNNTGCPTGILSKFVAACQLFASTWNFYMKAPLGIDLVDNALSDAYALSLNYTMYVLECVRTVSVNSTDAEKLGASFCLNQVRL